MKDKISAIWNNEELDSETKLANILDLTKDFVPKARVDEYSERAKRAENEKNALQTEYDDFKKSKMTDEEKMEAERKQFEADKKANAIEKSDLAVQKLLLKNGIEVKDDDIELKETLSTIVSEDYDKSIKLANSFISLLNKTKDITKQETTSELLGNTPKPIGGTESSSSLSRTDVLKQELEQAIKNKDTLAQTRLMTEIYQEENKPSI